MNFVAGFFFLGSLFTLAAAPLDDKALAFEKALNASPAVKAKVNPDPRFQARTPSPEDLQTMLHRGDQDASIEFVASQLMSSHPSALVQKTGVEFMQALEERRSRRAANLAAKAEDVLAEAMNAVTHAQKAADLDQVLATLTSLTGPQNQSLAFDASSQELVMKLNLALQFVSAWQDYLSASANGKTEEVQQALQRILGNTQLDSLGYFPRSEILARRDGNGTATVSSPGENPMQQVDDLLGKIKTVDDVLPTLGQINRIPNEPFNFSDIYTLEHARDDVMAGLPITLDLKKAMNGAVMGDDISRIVALELLSMLPYYFETKESDSPKANETVTAYLDRLAADANAAGNLGLLQRVLAIKIALTRGQPIPDYTPPSGTAEIFLAGLSQEDAGQYATAVVSYEKSLGDFDPLTPVKIVGDRLAAIKAAHPDEFNQGMTTFLTPPPRTDPRFPGWPNQPPRISFVSVLPIPLTMSVPAHPTPPTSPAGATPSANH